MSNDDYLPCEGRFLYRLVLRYICASVWLSSLVHISCRLAFYIISPCLARRCDFHVIYRLGDALAEHHSLSSPLSTLSFRSVSRGYFRFSFARNHLHLEIMSPVTRTQTGSMPLAPKENDGFGSSRPRHRRELSREPLRRQHNQKDTTDTPTTESQHSHLDAEASSSNNKPRELPRFTIDLSLPPEQRYVEVCAAFREEMRGLQGLFDEVVGGFVPWVPSGVLRWVCWVVLRGVWGEEERGELRVSRHLLGTCHLC
jgi:hypothetical protein